MKSKIDCDEKTFFYKIKSYFCGFNVSCCRYFSCKNNGANKLVDTNNIIHIPPPVCLAQPVFLAPSCCSPRGSFCESVDGGKGKCAICKKKSDDIVILPCGHGNHCTTCLENWYDTNDACPICGDKTIDVVQCL